MVTYNEVVNIIQNAANQHLQVASFGEGDPSQIEERDQADNLKYPLMWVYDRPHSVQDKSLHFNLTFVFGDLVRDDRSNETDVINDQILIAQDFIALLNNPEFLGDDNSAYLDKEQSITITPFTEQYSNRISGVQVDVRIRQAYEWNRCFTPTSGNTNCDGSDACTRLLNRLSESDKNECILPNYNFGDTTVTDNFTAQQTTDLTALLCTNDVVTELVYNASSTDVIEDTSVNANYAGTYTSDSNTNVATVQYEIDTGGGYSVETLPFTLAAGNGFKVTITRTTPSTESVVQLTGTY